MHTTSLPGMAAINVARLDGTVLSVLYSTDDGPYTVLRLRPAGGGYPVTVTGRFPSLSPGEAVAVEGTWEQHRRYGQQVRATTVRLVRPASADAIQAFLTSPLVPGVGTVMAERIVAQFGPETLAILDAEPERLQAVPGVGRLRAERIAEAWRSHAAYRAVLLALFEFGISHRRGMAIYEAFQENAPLIVRRQPYRLARTVRGIGFKTADAIARRVGLPLDAPARVEAGLLHVLRQAAHDGHTYLPDDALEAEATSLLGPEVPRALILSAIEHLVVEGELIAHERLGATALYLPPFDHTEAALARRLTTLLACPEDRLAGACASIGDDWEHVIDALPAALGAALAPEQRDALQRAFESRVSILTGGPGTGKTTTVRALVALAEQHHLRVLLAAPTGRAARRLAEVTGVRAVTLHRLLKLGLGGGARDDAEAAALVRTFADDEAPARLPVQTGRKRRRGEPLPADLVIVDEVSMVDLVLAFSLVRAVTRGTHLLLVGDPDQLPSIGAGSVLRDLLGSGLLPVTHLHRIFRQGAGSGIARNAARINVGEMPVWWPANGVDDFYVIHEPTPEKAVSLVVELVARRLPARFGVPPDEIQVLTPTHRGPAGVPSLNSRLQQALNPPGEAAAELNTGGRILRVGDRVVQMRNNYDLDIYNGDLGEVTDIDADRFLVAVRLEDGSTRHIVGTDLADLAHSYALTIHKAQGSEFSAVVLPILPAQYVLLSRRLLYTAVTRARRLVVIVGQTRAVSMAVRDAAVEERYTGLETRLREVDLVALSSHLSGERAAGVPGQEEQAAPVQATLFTTSN